MVGGEEKMMEKQPTKLTQEEVEKHLAKRARKVRHKVRELERSRVLPSEVWKSGFHGPGECVTTSEKSV
jgi:hypothetical protein